MDRQTKAMNEARSREKFMKERGWTESEIDIFIKSFVEGSEWSIESAYHQPSDKPIEGEMILCETKGFPMIAGPKHEDFNETVEHFGITRWAYTNDLLPGVVDSLEKKSINPQFKKGDVVVFKPYEKCMELGDFYNIPYEYRREYKLCQFTVEGFELKHNHIFYTLKSSQFPPISTPECFLDSLRVPEIKVANPKYNIGQYVIIKSEGELRLLYGKDADLTDLIPYVNQGAIIEDVIVVGDTITYKIRKYMMTGIIVGEDAIKALVPEYKKGQSVVIKSESDLRVIYNGYSILTHLLPLADKVVQIIDTIPSRDHEYTLYRIENEDSNIILDVTYNAILCDANDRSWIEPLECYRVTGSMVARDGHVAKLDTSKLNPSPMQIWNEMFSGTKGFLSSASPELRAFAAGQLLGLSEMIMKEFIDGKSKDNGMV